MKIFQIYSDNRVNRIQNKSFSSERQLQNFCEHNLEELFGIRLLRSEFPLVNHRSRIDTLAIDKDLIPVIIEYKLSASASIINQGLHYKDDLANYKAEIIELIKDKLGQNVGLRDIKFSETRVICIALEFDAYIKPSHYPKEVELITYKLYDGLIIFDSLSGLKTKPKALEGDLKGLAVVSSDTNILQKDWFIYRKNGKNTQIRQEGDKFTILRGSYVSAGVTSSLAESSPAFIAFRERKLVNCRKAGQFCILNEDISFPSDELKHRKRSGANQACAFACGHGMNVWTTFKDKNGQSMDLVLRKNKSLRK